MDNKTLIESTLLTAHALAQELNRVLKTSRFNQSHVYHWKQNKADMPEECRKIIEKIVKARG